MTVVRIACIVCVLGWGGCGSKPSAESLRRETVRSEAECDEISQRAREEIETLGPEIERLVKDNTESWKHVLAVAGLTLVDAAGLRVVRTEAPWDDPPPLVHVVTSYGGEPFVTLRKTAGRLSGDSPDGSPLALGTTYEWLSAADSTTGLTDQGAREAGTVLLAVDPQTRRADTAPWPTSKYLAYVGRLRHTETRCGSLSVAARWGLGERQEMPLVALDAEGRYATLEVVQQPTVVRSLTSCYNVRAVVCPAVAAVPTSYHFFIPLQDFADFAGKRQIKHPVRVIDVKSVLFPPPEEP